MSGLMTPHTAPDGRRMMVESDVLDICNRIQQGDPTTGWAGDPGMWVEFDVPRNAFVVRRIDPRTGGEVDVMSYRPPLDTGLLVKLAQGDTQRRGNDPVKRILEENTARERAQEAEFDSYVEEEVAPRLVHAMREDGLDVGRLVVPFNDLVVSKAMP